MSPLSPPSFQNDTMVVLHSDHGWHLGEYAMWEKRTNWELGTRVREWNTRTRLRMILREYLLTYD